jgi:hypothetical protein
MDQRELHFIKNGDFSVADMRDWVYENWSVSTMFYEGYEEALHKDLSLFRRCVLLLRVLLLCSQI